MQLANKSASSSKRVSPQPLPSPKLLTYDRDNVEDPMLNQSHLMDQVESTHSFEAKAQSYIQELTSMVEKILSSLPSFKKTKNGTYKTSEQATIVEGIVQKSLAGLSKLVEKFKTQCANFIREQLKTLRDTTPALDKLQELKENMRDEFLNFQSDDVNESGLFDLDLRKQKFETRIKRLKKDLELCNPASVLLNSNDTKLLRALQDGVEFVIANQKMHFHAVNSKDLKSTPSSQEKKHFVSTRKNSLRQEVLKSRSKSPQINSQERSFFSNSSDLHNPPPSSFLDSDIAVSVAGTNMTLSKTGILKNYSGNSFLIQPLQFSQVFIVADLEHKTITQQFGPKKFPNFFAACMKNNLCHMTGGTVTQTVPFHYCLTPTGQVSRLADILEKRKFHSMAAFKASPFLFVSGGVRDQKTPMDKAERYDTKKDDWIMCSKMFQKRHSHCSVGFRDLFLYVLCGVGIKGLIDSIQRFCVPCNRWQMMQIRYKDKFWKPRKWIAGQQVSRDHMLIYGVNNDNRLTFLLKFQQEEIKIVRKMMTEEVPRVWGVQCPNVIRNGFLHTFTWNQGRYQDVIGWEIADPDWQVMIPN